VCECVPIGNDKSISDAHGLDQPGAVLQDLTYCDVGLSILCKLRPVGGDWLIESHLITFDEKVDQHSHEWLACREYPEKRVLAATNRLIQHDFAISKNAYLGRCLSLANAFQDARHACAIDPRFASLILDATHRAPPSAWSSSTDVLRTANARFYGSRLGNVPWPVGVEKLILGELAENSSRQDVLQAIFADRVDILYHRI
jgi:hypothetical protein